MEPSRSFSFFRAGGFDQVRFDSGTDLARLSELDQKLWVALSCPTQGLALDARTLELIDTDKDGRIRAPELIAAVQWTTALLKNADDLLQGRPQLPLEAINDLSDEGKKIRVAAQAILESLGKAEAGSICVEDMAEAAARFDAMPFNGDGVITPCCAKDGETKQLIEEIIDCVGGVQDRSGQVGIDANKVAEFFGHLTDFAAWLKRGEDDPSTVPLGDETMAAHAALDRVRVKIDDYFTRCRLAAFDERAQSALNREEKEYSILATQDLTPTSPDIQALPLARIAAAQPLRLTEGLNPAWSDAMAAFAAQVARPLLCDAAVLSDGAWFEIKQKFSPYEAWLAEKAGVPVEKLGKDRIRILVETDARASLNDLFALEKAQESKAQSLVLVEKLVRCYRDLYRLLKNFVSFQDFYGRNMPAVFQAGRLFLDQRECRLCIRVDDIAKHATMSPLSRAFIAYCDCVRGGTGEKMCIAAAITDGDSDNLMVGRNGVFYDNEGKDWDATIVKLVDNPISIRQAFWSPYKKLARFVEDQVTRRASAGEAKSNDMLTGSTKTVEGAVDGSKPSVTVAKKFDVGVVAAIGVAVGGITAAIGALLQAFFGLGLWMPFGLLGLLLLISGPSMLMAWLKLRQRNIGPLLDANGWAINAKALLNVPFGRSLTRIAEVPKRSRIDKMDPFASKQTPWKLYLSLAIILSLAWFWYLGKLDRFLPPPGRSTAVLGAYAPVSDELPPKAENAQESPSSSPTAP